MSCYFNLKLLRGKRVTFWHPSFFNIGYSVALMGAGLILISVPASPASTAGGGDSPSYSGFFHCLAVFDDQVPRVLTQTAVYCRMYEIPPHGSFILC